MPKQPLAGSSVIGCQRCPCDTNHLSYYIHSSYCNTLSHSSSFTVNPTPFLVCHKLKVHFYLTPLFPHSSSQPHPKLPISTPVIKQATPVCKRWGKDGVCRIGVRWHWVKCGRQNHCKTTALHPVISPQLRVVILTSFFVTAMWSQWNSADTKRLC